MENIPLTGKIVKKLILLSFILIVGGLVESFFGPGRFGPDILGFACFSIGFLAVLGSLLLIILNKRKIEIKKRLLFIPLVYFVISFLFILLFVWAFLGPRYRKSPAARITADLVQIRNIAEVLYDEDYDGLNLNHPDVAVLAKDIKENGGSLVLHQKGGSYCVYSILPGQKEKEWYCVDSTGQADFTAINPDQEIYCQKNNFKCPPVFFNP